MVPSTTKISASEGTMPLTSFAASAQPRRVRASGGSAGTAFGRRIDSTSTQAANKRTWTMEAPVAPTYMVPADWPSCEARTMSTREGGISCAMVPDAAMTPVAWRTL
jgi:hypothetical protein